MCSLRWLQCLNINKFLQEGTCSFDVREDRFGRQFSWVSLQLNGIKDKLHAWDKMSPGLRALTHLDMVVEESITCRGVTKSQNCNHALHYCCVIQVPKTGLEKLLSEENHQNMKLGWDSTEPSGATGCHGTVFFCGFLWISCSVCWLQWQTTSQKRILTIKPKLIITQWKMSTQSISSCVSMAVLLEIKVQLQYAGVSTHDVKPQFL